MIKKKLKKKLVKHTFFEISDKKKLNANFLKKIRCDIIFFVHWHYMVPSNILKKFKCVLFHTAPLPYGRGGSPIQNLIIEGYKDTPVCALEMVEELDAGPILIKKTISLKGSLAEIFNRIEATIIILIKKILTENISPKKQKGKIVKFSRLNERDNEIPRNLELNKFYDRIRMLDGPDYPNAFIKYGNKVLYFKNATYKKGKIACDIEIREED